MRVLYQESGEDIEMAETYSREDLGKLKRSELRALAVSDKVGMTFQEASTARSEDMVEIILKKLGGAGAKKGAPAAKGKSAGKSAPEPEPEEAAEEAEEAAEEAAVDACAETDGCAGADSGSRGERCHVRTGGRGGGDAGGSGAWTDGRA